MNEQQRFDLQQHLLIDHKKTPWSSYLKEIVYGGNDGIVTTFAVVAGFAGASAGESMLGIAGVTVLLFGLANLFADAASMGLGNFLSIRSQKDLYRKEAEKELIEIQTNPERERLESIEVLMKKGYSEIDATSMTSLLMKNESYWLAFMMRDELGMDDLEGENPIYSGMATFFSFIFFGSIPLIPYILFGSQTYTFNFSIFFTLCALILLGLLRWRITQQTIIRSVGEVLLIGGISASIAFIVGTLFRI